jgi:hypothetical protein
MGTRVTAIRTRRGFITGALIGIALALLPWRPANVAARGLVVRNGWILRADD